MQNTGLFGLLIWANQQLKIFFFWEKNGYRLNIRLYWIIITNFIESAARLWFYWEKICLSFRDTSWNIASEIRWSLWFTIKYYKKKRCRIKMAKVW